MKMTREDKKKFLRALSNAHTDLFHTMTPWMDSLFLTVADNEFKSKFDYENLARELYFMKAKEFIAQELFNCEVDNTISDLND